MRHKQLSENGVIGEAGLLRTNEVCGREPTYLTVAAGVGSMANMACEQGRLGGQDNLMQESIMLAILVGPCTSRGKQDDLYG